jgi:hypothetical protein
VADKPGSWYLWVEMIRLAAALLVALAAPALADVLQGKVIEDHTGNPLASVELRVSRPGARMLVADLETDTNGTFHTPEIGAVEYRIEVSKPNFLTATLRAAPGRPLLIRLVRCGVITGQVVDQQGRPVRGATAYALPKSAGGAPLRAALGNPGTTSSLDARGQYRLFNLTPGEYAVAISYGASTVNVGSTGSAPSNPAGSGVQFYPANARPQFFTIAGGEDYRGIDFTISPAALYKVSGKVELPAPSKERAVFWVALTSPEQPVMAAAVAQADVDGSFHLEGVPPGAYQVFVSGPSNGRNSFGAVMPPEPYFGRSRIEVGPQNVEDLSLSVRKGRSATFVLPAVAGCPHSGRLTLTSLEDWAALLERTAEISTEKALVLDNLAPARYQAALSNLGAACYQPDPAIVDLNQPAEPVKLTVALAGAIRGRITGTEEPTGFAVALVAPGASTIQVALPDREGRFTFEELRPGHYYIAAQAAGESPKARWVPDLKRMVEIEIPGGAPTDLELPASPVAK